MSDGQIDYATSGGGRLPVADAAELVDRAVDEKNLTRLRFGLGALSGDRSGAAVTTVLAHMDLLDAEPVGVGRYLRSVSSSLWPDALDAMIDHAYTETGDRGLAGRIHVARALAKADLVDMQRARLLEAASIAPDRRLQPLNAYLITAACEGSKSARILNGAVELAEVTDNFDLRRSVLHHHRKSQMPRHRAVATHMCRLEPELAPFVA